MADDMGEARAFLAGKALRFKTADELWRNLKRKNELSTARAVLAEIRSGRNLLDPVPANRKRGFCQQHALLISKDPELSAAIRHDQALAVLKEEFDLDDPALDSDGETLGIAAGILKRRWNDIGQLEDLMEAGRLYERAADGSGVGRDAYPHVNAAFVNDLLAELGDHPAERRGRARDLRHRIIKELAPLDDWFNAASRAEALFGLGRYPEAQAELKRPTKPCEPWELETTARQLATLAHIREARPLEVPEIQDFFQTLLPGAGDAVRSVMVGKVGLALSGGGFRASFFHIGVLARLAELDVLRHVEVLSCVSGGSIVGASYWLELRRRMLTEGRRLEREDYIDAVKALIAHFQRGVETNIRRQDQPSPWRALRNVVAQRGALDPEQTALALEAEFYRPIFDSSGAPIYMDQLPFTPKDHNAALAGADEFHPGKHNWLRADKVPVLVLNATTVNTGHAWQFTPTWMGESPWAVHAAADSVPRLEWSWYNTDAGWRMRLGRAVAASACVPGIFSPLRIDDAYDGIRVQLVDGGVYDNQGTASLLALDCNVVLVSDASGQLLFEDEPKPGVTGLASYAQRSMDVLMARVRLATFADLTARQQAGLLRGFMFLHMKAGLDSDAKRLRFSQESYELRRTALTPAGVRRDFQQALAELRTDLDAFTQDEAGALMACGYQMATAGFERDLGNLAELSQTAASVTWPFLNYLQEITSVQPATARRESLLQALRTGSKLTI